MAWMCPAWMCSEGDVEIGAKSLPCVEDAKQAVLVGILTAWADATQAVLTVFAGCSGRIEVLAELDATQQALTAFAGCPGRMVLR